MQITVNGAPHELAAPLSLSGLVETLGLAGRRLAIERNGEIVPRSRYAEVELTAGDRVEIVHAIGGG